MSFGIPPCDAPNKSSVALKYSCARSCLQGDSNVSKSNEAL
jgi:hypothetical protein